MKTDKNFEQSFVLTNQSKSNCKEKDALTNSQYKGNKGGTNSKESETISNNCPWLNSDGSKKADSEISKLGESWSAETWNNYLNSDVGTIKNDPNTVSFPYMDTATIANGGELVKYLRNLEEYEDLEEYLDYAVKTLSKREREVVRLKYWQGLTQNQIAKKLNIKPDTVKKLRKRALKKLKSCLCSSDFKESVKALKSLKK